MKLKLSFISGLLQINFAQAKFICNKGLTSDNVERHVEPFQYIGYHYYPNTKMLLSDLINGNIYFFP